MKKKLLKPPAGDGEILFLPDYKGFLSSISGGARVCVAHQPYFFNPGVSVKFLLLDEFLPGKKEMVFVDTDRVRLEVRVPSRGGWPRRVELVSTDGSLFRLPSPAGDVYRAFFDSLKSAVKESGRDSSPECLEHIERYESILIPLAERGLLKEALAESFLEYHGIQRPYTFLSDMLAGDDYTEFVGRIVSGAGLFREVFNRALDDYREEFRFRFKNFPFPKLDEGELPFWLVEEGMREKCYERDLHRGEFGRPALFPRAAALTLFLRIFKCDVFIHGVGGWNYEWVGDRIAERFFGVKPPPYAAVSGTFLLRGTPERDIPYFFFPPARIRQSVREFVESR